MAATPRSAGGLHEGPRDLYGAPHFGHVVRSMMCSTRASFAFLYPKTPRARRTIGLPPSLVEWLKRRRVGQAERRLLLV